MKKLLALVLAMVMTLGLATVGASAAAYTDADSIDFKEAVEVMSALKVFDGQNGAFNPNGVLTREQGAKIIAYMILGKSAADSLTTAKSSFADVAPERWSAGAIEYCVSTKIVGGAGKDANGNDVFNPEAELTGYAFAKMCLVALGYNPNYEDFVGGDWAINVAKCAADAGLDKDLASLVMSKGITREQAAQMALNTEKATMVDYKNPINVKSSDGMEVTVNAERNNVGSGTYNYRYTGVAADSNTVDANFTQFVERYNQSPKVTLTTNSTDDFDRPANIWKQGNATIGKYAKTPTVTYTAGVKGGTVYSDLGGSNIDFAAMGWNSGSSLNRITFSVNGAPVDNDISSTYTKDFADVIVRGNTTDNLPGTGNGVKTEVFYSRADNTLDIIQTTTLLVKAETDYDANRKTITVSPVTVDPEFALLTSISGERFPVVAGATKDTYFYVSAYKNGGKAYIDSVSAVAADRFLAGVTLSSKADSSMVADGQSYSKAANYLTSSGDDKLSTLTLQTVKYNFVLDPYGYVMTSAQTTSSTEYKDKYIFVENAGQSGLSAQARIIKMDGTTATITVTKATTATTGTITPDTVTKTKDKDHATTADWGEKANGVLISQAFYTFKTNDDGSYSLTYAQGTTVTSGTLTKNQPAQIASATMTNKTAFVVGSGSSYAAYLGVANFPGTNAGKYHYVLAPNTSVVAALYHEGTAANSEADKYVFLFNGYTEAQDSASGSPYYLYDAFVDGAKSADKVAANAQHVGGLFKVSYNSKDRLVLSSDTYVGSSVVDKVGVFEKAYMEAAGGNISIVGSNDSAVYTVASDAEFYYIDCYNSNDSVTYTNATAAASRTTGGFFRIITVQKSTSDKSVSKVFIITNRGTGANW